MPAEAGPRPESPMSLVARLGFMVGILGSILVCSSLALSYLALVHQLDRQAKDQLRGKLQQVRHVFAEWPDSSHLTSDLHRISDVLIGHDELHLAVTSKGQSVPRAVFSEVARLSLEHLPSPGSEDDISEWRYGGRHYLTLADVARMGKSEEFTVVVTADRNDDDQLLAYLLRMALYAAPVALLLVAAGAWGIIRHGLRPLYALRRGLASVTTRDISFRLDESRLPIELWDLAQAFNRMLQGLEEGVSRLSKFSGDLAHEMRTPLSNLLGQTQVSLSKTRTAESYRAVLESNAEEFERLKRLVEDMLFLAQADHAVAALQLESIDLATEARRVAEYFEFAAEDKGLHIAINGDGTVYADRLMIQRVISNLLSNALRYAPSGSAITIAIANNENGTAIQVSNLGEGIDATHQKHLFERFYRADPSRSRAEGGTGLGLAIVRSIMIMHGGEVSVRSAKDGVTMFELVFPPKAG